MNRHDMERAVRKGVINANKQQQRENEPHEPMGDTWLFFFGLATLLVFALIFKSVLLFAVGVVAIWFSFIYLPYLLAIAVPISAMYLFVRMMLTDSRNYTEPTFSLYVQGFAEGWYFWIPIVLISLFSVYRSR